NLRGATRSRCRTAGTSLTSHQATERVRARDPIATGDRHTWQKLPTFADAPDGGKKAFHLGGLRSNTCCPVRSWSRRHGAQYRELVPSLQRPRRPSTWATSTWLDSRAIRGATKSSDLPRCRTQPDARRVWVIAAGGRARTSAAGQR